MITKQDLDSAIAECQGQRNPTAGTCMKLAAFYTIRKELFQEPERMYSYAPPPEEPTAIGNYGTSDFLTAVEGKPIQSVLHIMDELMESMQVLQPRIYNSVMRKISAL